MYRIFSVKCPARRNSPMGWAICLSYSSREISSVQLGVQPADIGCGNVTARNIILADLAR